MSRIYGYARVSTQKQKLKLQVDALKKIGCNEIVEDHISAFAPKRTKFEELIKKLQKDDTLVVWKLDRLGREMFDLFKIIAELDAKGVHFVSLTENIDTKTASGRVMFGFFSIMAEYETTLKKERAEAGREAAREAGKRGGRPKGLSKKTLDRSKGIAKIYLELDENNNYKHSVSSIIKTLKISRKTLYECLRHEKITIGKRINPVNFDRKKEN